MIIVICRILNYCQITAVTLETCKAVQTLTFLYKLVNGLTDDVNLLANVRFNVPVARSRNNLTFRCRIRKTNYTGNSPNESMCRLFNNHCNDFDLV